MEELTQQSLEDAIVSIRTMTDDRGVLIASSPTMVVGTAAQAATLKTTGRYNLTDHMTQPSLTVHGKPVDIKPFQADPTEAMLVDKSSPYNIDPETLVNLWAVRFGKEWVGTEAVSNSEDEVEFWKHTANRLRALGYLEMHTLASSYRVVLRIVE